MPERVVWDVFISHASEDKDDFVRPLARGLGDRGLNVWFDEYTLTVGDSLRRSIDRGLAGSRFGIVVISPDFLHKEWPQRELDGLVAREIGGGKVILPVWHNISAEQIRQYSPTLADRLAVSSARGLDHVIAELMRVIEQADATGGATRAAAQRPPVDFGTSFEKLPVGSLFRFYQRDETAFGLKAIFNYGSGDTAALVLTPAAGLRPGDLLSAHEIRDVVQLRSARVVPSTNADATTPGRGNVAEPGEIELRGEHLIFVTQMQGSGSGVLRVNLQSGEIGRATGAPPLEIYSEWSLVRTDGTHAQPISEHKGAQVRPANFRR